MNQTYLIELIVTWLFLALVVGELAEERGHSAKWFFLFSILFSPLLTFIILLCISPRESVIKQRQIDARTHRKCPFCAENISIDATHCKECRKKLPKLEEPSQEITKPKDRLSQQAWGLCGALIMIPLVARLIYFFLPWDKILFIPLKVLAAIPNTFLIYPMLAAILPFLLSLVFSKKRNADIREFSILAVVLFGLSFFPAAHS